MEEKIIDSYWSKLKKGFGKSISMYFAALAAKDSTLYPIFCCRDKNKAKELEEYVELSGLSKDNYAIFLTDLSSSSSVDKLAARIRLLQLTKALVNNAGSMFGSYQTNAEEIEMNMR